MKRLLHIFIAIATVSLTNCSQDDNAPTPSTNPGGGGGNITATCSDGIQNGDETGVDCGGSSCTPCIPSGGCYDFIDCDYSPVTIPDLSMFQDTIYYQSNYASTYSIINGNISCCGYTGYVWSDNCKYEKEVPFGNASIVFQYLHTADNQYGNHNPDSLHINQMKLGRYKMGRYEDDYTDCLQPIEFKVISVYNPQTNSNYVVTDLSQCYYEIYEKTIIHSPSQIEDLFTYRIRGKIDCQNLKLETDTSQTINISGYVQVVIDNF